MFKVLKSRTVWMFIVLFVINGIGGVRELLPGFWLPLVDAIVAVLGTYFRTNRRVDFSK